MPTLPSNNSRYLLAQAEIDFGADTFNLILMRAGFAFSRVTHNEYADIIADELPTANGYTIGGNVLAGVTVTRDDTDNVAIITWNNTAWLATGGSIVTQGACIIDTTVVNDPVIGYIDFGEALTTFETGNFTVASISVEI